MFYYTQSASCGWPALQGQLSCAALSTEKSSSKHLALPHQIPIGVRGSLGGGGEAAPFGQHLSSRRSSCGSLQSQPAPLAGACPSGLMPPKNCLAPSSKEFCSAPRSCQSWGSAPTSLFYLHCCSFRTGKC